MSCTSIANYLGDRGADVQFTSDSRYSGLLRQSRDALKPLIRSFTYRREEYVRYSRGPLSRLFRSLPSIASLDRDAVSLLLIDRIPPVEFLLELSRSEAPVVLLLHGLSLETVLPPNPLATAYQLYLRAAMRELRLLSKSPHVFFQVFNDAMRRRLQSVGIAASRIFVIPSGLELGGHPVSGVNPSFGLVFIGRLEIATKGIDFLARVLEDLSSTRPADLNAVILGSGPSRPVLDRLERHSWIRQPGFVAESEKLSVLQESSLMLVTSYIEPFSMVTIEALATGVPVITTPSLGPSSIVGTNADFGRILPYNSKSFCGAIFDYYREWKQDKTEYARRAASVSRAARDQFSVNNMGDGYVKLIEAVQRALR